MVRRNKGWPLRPGPAICAQQIGAWRRLQSAWGLLCFALLLFGMAANAWAEATVRDIRIAQHEDGVRVVVELSRDVPFDYVTLGGPPRLAIDLPEVAWLVPESEGMRQIGINGYRFGRFRPGVSRLVVDVARPFSVRRLFELPGPRDGHRIVFDLTIDHGPQVTLAGASPAAANGTTNGAAHGTNGTAITPEQKVAAITPFKLPLKKPEPRVIVIDPGHGGRDPGAIGVTGVREKDVVLKMARELRRQLEATGRYKVKMTRDSDSDHSACATERGLLANRMVSCSSPCMQTVSCGIERSTAHWCTRCPRKPRIERLPGLLGRRTEPTSSPESICRIRKMW